MSYKILTILCWSKWIVLAWNSPWQWSYECFCLPISHHCSQATRFCVKHEVLRLYCLNHFWRFYLTCPVYPKTSHVGIQNTN